MPKLQKIYKIYSIIFIAFGLISFGFSAFSDLLGLINKNIQYDAVSEAEMLPFINGGVFIIIGGLLQMLAGLYGFRASEEIGLIFKPIVLSVVDISWQLTGFIILFSNHHFNIRLVLQIPMTFIFLLLACLIKFKSSAGLKKKRVNISPVPGITGGEKKLKKIDIASFFKINYSKKHIHKPQINTGRRIKRINIKPRRRFKK